MEFTRRSVISLAAGPLVIATAGRRALAAAPVAVTLWDKGEASMEGMETMAPMGMAAAGAPSDMATMGIRVDAASLAAGDVTFNVLNDSQEYYHNLAIAAVADASKELPYLADKRMVDEAAAGVIARSKDLRPHASQTMTVTLGAGTYILFCNVAGHYAMGMWTLVSVT